MKRVLVIGCPGAGKTTFAKKLASKTGLPLVHLDYYYHDKSKNYYAPENKPAWFEKVRELVKADKWIIDGNYSSTYQERFQKADTILFFDFPRRTRLAGIFKRRWHYRNKKRSDMPEDWDEKISWEFFKFVWSYEKYHPKITNALNKETAKKLIIFKNRSQANEYLEKLKVTVQ